MTFSDLEWVSKISNYMERRAASLQQLTFLFSIHLNVVRFRSLRGCVSARWKPHLESLQRAPIALVNDIVLCLLCCRHIRYMFIQIAPMSQKLETQNCSFSNTFAARCYASAVYAVMRCLCVCPSVTFVNSVKRSNRSLIFKMFSRSGSQTILVFLYQRHGNILTGTLLTEASNADG